MPTLIVGIQFPERDFEHLDHIPALVMWQRIHKSFELRE